MKLARLQSGLSPVRTADLSLRQLVGTHKFGKNKARNYFRPSFRYPTRLTGRYDSKLRAEVPQTSFWSNQRRYTLRSLDRGDSEQQSEPQLQLSFGIWKQVVTLSAVLRQGHYNVGKHTSDPDRSTLTYDCLPRNSCICIRTSPVFSWQNGPLPEVRGLREAGASSGSCPWTSSAANLGETAKERRGRALKVAFTWPGQSIGWRMASTWLYIMRCKESSHLSQYANAPVVPCSWSRNRLGRDVGAFLYISCFAYSNQWYSNQTRSTLHQLLVEVDKVHFKCFCSMGYTSGKGLCC